MSPCVRATRSGLVMSRSRSAWDKPGNPFNPPRRGFTLTRMVIPFAFLRSEVFFMDLRVDLVRAG